MYERLTDRARNVMQLANKAALELHHEWITSRHILLALLQEGKGFGIKVLCHFSVDLVRLQQAVLRQLPAGSPDTVIMGRLPQTPDGKHVIEHAVQEARNFNDNHVGTEHLLLGLLTVAQLQGTWHEFGVTVQAAREQLLTMRANQLKEKMVAATDSYIMALVHRIDWEALEELCRICKVVRQLQPLGAVWQMAVQMSQDDASK